jgi:hypothetical protein
MTESNRLHKSRHYHRKPVRAINTVLSVLNTFGIAEVKLDEATLINAAKRATGLDDFGKDEFSTSLRVLLNSLENEAELNPIGRFLVSQTILGILKGRLWAADLYKKHPEINDIEIKSPVIVMGLARAGTTRLHRLLACDQSFHHIKSWEAWNPVPWPGSFTQNPDPRIAMVEKGLKFVFYMTPGMAAVHPLELHAPEEELGLIQQSFSSQLWEVTNLVPGFTKWLEENDQAFAYEYMVKVLKIIAWFRGDTTGTWLLKTPNHMQHFKEMAKVFPDARLIFTHRDPVRCVGSMCSVAWNGLLRDTDNLDAKRVGAEWNRKIEVMLRRGDEGRTDFPKNQILDLQYEDLNRAPVDQIKKVYKFLGRKFTQETEEAMQLWLKNNQQNKHGVHRYYLEDFGLDAAEVREKFSWYWNKYSIQHEDKVNEVQEVDA